MLAAIMGYGQNIGELLTYSSTNYGSTARSLGVGNAFGALGADFSTASSNPAGMAEFRKSEFVISFGPLLQNIESDYDGQLTSESRSRFTFDNLGFVFNNTPIGTSIKRSNFFIGFNKTANFNQKIYFDGQGTGSIVERFIENSDGFFPDELDNFETGPAYEVGAIYDFDNNNAYDSDFQGNFNSNIRRTQDVIRSGGINEMTIGLAGNWKEKISFGGTMGLPFLKYSETKRYAEFDSNNSIDNFERLEFNENLETQGFGVNLKLGLLIKPISRLRLGVALHTPTVFILTDNFDTDIRYIFSEGGVTEDFSSESPFSEFEYQVNTPWKAIFSAGYLLNFGKIKGFISGEADYVNYTAGSFNLTTNSNDPSDVAFENELNTEVSAAYRSTWNYRLGTELAYSHIRIRAGINITASPYSDDSGTLESSALHLGLGYRANRYYVDLGAAMSSTEFGYTPYSLFNQGAAPLIVNNTDNLKMKMTFGFKF